MIILETEHLLFRPLTLDDLDDMTALYTDPEVTRFLAAHVAGMRYNAS
ncbi:GNAT family N-acetyltransferase [Dictyobacter kobayashii]|nr:GNAT family N-acetyltransferase [Dictyobacter kobayashii]